jgi:hypothetical protein
MCDFITLIVPSDDVAAIDEVMRAHGRTATPTANAALAGLLLSGEHQYLTTRTCDCGTALLTPASGATLETALAAEAGRLRRKHWSSTKIARAIADRRRAAARPGSPGRDSLALWAAIIADLRARLRVSRIGLFVHHYSGAIDSEMFTGTRRVVPPGAATIGELAAIVPDEVTIFA